MCTAVACRQGKLYFGRTLDYEYSYGEKVVFLPKKYPINYRYAGIDNDHYAILGMAHMADGMPLFYDGVNEKGLCMAGLNFVGNAEYSDALGEGDNILQCEFIPRILSRCATVAEARMMLDNICLLSESYNDRLPTASLHWIISDAKEDIVVEFMSDGMHIFDNPVGVLTNNPPFGQQMFNLNQYRSLSPKQPENCFSDKVPLELYSRGMGAIGLPGDLSSPSRFVRAAFANMNSIAGNTENERVCQYFHIMDTVIQTRGCCEVAEGEYEISIYTSCCNAEDGIYYYKTYDNSRIAGVDMHRENLEGDTVICFEIDKTPLYIQN
ncbi:MAG: choloylglycine hydrolase [Butyrivibrio sp.]|nr:choloylglycine hydrolase [Butyrivibrio sp.]